MAYRILAMSLLLLYNTSMEDDLQLIEKFSSDEWKNLVRHEVLSRTKWNVSIDFQVNDNKNLNRWVDLCFQATFTIGQTAYTITFNHDLYRARDIGSSSMTQYVIYSFTNSLRNCEKDEKIAIELVRNVEPPRQVFSTIWY